MTRRDSMSADKAKASKGCWTCKDRKVQCDRGLPKCQKCVRTRRDCQGYGLRLSWPKDSDRRRGMVGSEPVSTVKIRVRHGYEHEFFNTTWWDVDLYNHLIQQSGSTRPLPGVAQIVPRLWKQPQSKVDHLDLIYHFNNAAHLSLVVFTPTTLHIRDILLRLALAHDSLSGRALLHALFAFSTLHRVGIHQDALKFKLSALNALSASSEGGNLSWTDAIQHVAACMLLCAFEILLPSESSGEWLWYIRGALDVIQSTRLEEQTHSSDVGDLLDWFYYHYTLSRFAMHHWRDKPMMLDITGANTLSSIDHKKQSPPAQCRKTELYPHHRNPTYTILNLLSEVCDTLLDPRDPRSHDAAYKTRLEALESKIRSLPPTPPTALTNTDLSLSVDLYQLATLIYLTRASQSPFEAPAKLDSLVERAFAGPVQNPSCHHFFPLLILACEARTDEMRTSILRLIDRTEKDVRVRSMAGLREQVKGIWVQQDLFADSDVVENYADLMNALISSNETLPSFA